LLLVLPALLVGLCCRWASAAPATVAGIRAYAAPFATKAASRPPDAVFANFAGDGAHYRRYRSERELKIALASFLNGPAPGGGSFIARVWHVAGSSALYVTFESAVQTSLTERERILYDGAGRAMWLHQEVQSYNGYFRTVRDAFFAAGVAIADTTTRYDYAPTDAAFVKPISIRKAELGDTTLPSYGTRAKLPFAA
jgi:hypothetical protein